MYVNIDSGNICDEYTLVFVAPCTGSLSATAKLIHTHTGHCRISLFYINSINGRKDLGKVHFIRFSVCVHAALCMRVLYGRGGSGFKNSSYSSFYLDIAAQIEWVNLLIIYGSYFRWNNKIVDSGLQNALKPLLLILNKTYF